MSGKRAKLGRQLSAAYMSEVLVKDFALARAKKHRLLRHIAPRFVAWLDERAISRAAPILLDTMKRAGKTLGRK